MASDQDDTGFNAPELSGLDAVRLLCNAIQKVQHFDREQEGISPLCRNVGELILQDALEYLAWGDTHNARQVMDIYDRWKATGDAPWPWDSDKSP
ncbi:hypothetical protein [Sulfitobacter sp. 1A16808]|uniref:hypothetical protein n=1 Tax=Sulfitobacter sp. 1A16808 TaxID=3368572 RepID=UPI003745EF9F